MQEKILEIITESHGEASVEFMSQGDTRAGDIVMPEKELLEIAQRTTKRVMELIEEA